MDEDRFFMLNRGDIELRLDPVFYKPSIIAFVNTIKKLDAKPVHAIATRVVDGPFGTQLKVEEYQPEGIPVVRVSNVRTGEISEDNLIYITPEKQFQLRRSKVLPNDVILTKAGAILGYSAVFPEHLKEGNITSHSAAITCGEDVLPHYLKMIFHFSIGQKQIYRWGNKSTRPELNTQEVKRILIPVPSLERQKDLVNEYHRIIEIRKSKEAQAAKLLESIDDYLLSELGITLPPEPDNTIENRKFRAEWANVTGNRFDPDYYSYHYQNKIESIENGRYGTQPLSQVTDLVLNGKTPSSDSYSDTETDYPLIKVGSYTGKFIDLDKVSYSKKPLSRFVEKGDIFILSAAHQAQYVGRHIKLLEQTPEIPTSYVGELICVRPDTQLIQPYFLFSLLSTEVYKTLINREKTGQTSHVYPSDIRKIKLPIPDLDHQREMETEIIRRYNEARDLTASAILDFLNAKHVIEQLILNPK